MINKKALGAACFAVILVFGQAAFAEDVLLSDENVFFYYESRADIPAPDYKLAEYISVDYRRARDEFTRHDLMEKIKPVLNQKLAEAAENDAVAVRVNIKLEEYDFDNNAFPTGLSGSTFIPFNHRYALSFKNGEKASFIPVPIDKARGLSSALRSDRSATATIHVKLVGAEETKLNWNTNKALVGQITQIDVRHTSGEHVGNINIE